MDSDLGEISCVSKMRLDLSECDSQYLKLWISRYNPMLSSMRLIITEHDDSLHKAWLRFLAYREPSTKNQSVPSATDRVIYWVQIILHGFRRSLSCRFRKAGMEKHRTRPMTGNHRCYLNDVYDRFCRPVDVRRSTGRCTKRAILRCSFRPLSPHSWHIFSSMNLHDQTTTAHMITAGHYPT